MQDTNSSLWCLNQNDKVVQVSLRNTFSPDPQVWSWGPSRWRKCFLWGWLKNLFPSAGSSRCHTLWEISTKSSTPWRRVWLSSQLALKTSRPSWTTCAGNRPHREENHDLKARCQEKDLLDGGAESSSGESRIPQTHNDRTQHHVLFSALSFLLDNKQKMESSIWSVSHWCF